MARRMPLKLRKKGFISSDHRIAGLSVSPALNVSVYEDDLHGLQFVLVLSLHPKLAAFIMAPPQRHNVPRFEYQILRGNEIRLLQIRPSSPLKRDQTMSDSPIYCDLHHFPLVEPASSGNLVARLANTKSTWDISAHELGFRIVGKPKRYKSVFLKLKEVLSKNKGRHSAINGRFPWGDYVALSYTWGNADEISEIFINGKPIKVRPNLECALRVLREKGPIRAGMKVWIDALCLNQMDMDEKNAQVPRMREIYQRA